MKGTIIKLETGALAFEVTQPDYSRPVIRRQVWPVIGERVEGYRGANISDAIGRESTVRDGRVSCYLGEGAWLMAQLPQLGATHSIIMEEREAPHPKVRKTTQTRWLAGCWQKYDGRKGWIAA